MKITNGRPEPSFDKKSALHDFLVDLHLARVPTKLTIGLFDQLLSVLQIEMDPGDKENYAYWVKKDCEYLANEIKRYRELDREMNIEKERERIKRLNENESREEEFWTKVPTWVYCVASIIIYQVVIAIYR